LLILDEPVNGLDPEEIVSIRLLLQLAEEEKVTILLSTHLLDEMAKLATTIGMIHEGPLYKK